MLLINISASSWVEAILKFKNCDFNKSKLMPLRFFLAFISSKHWVRSFSIKAIAAFLILYLLHSSSVTSCDMASLLSLFRKSPFIKTLFCFLLLLRIFKHSFFNILPTSSSASLSVAIIVPVIFFLIRWACINLYSLFSSAKLLQKLFFSIEKVYSYSKIS